MTVYHLLIINRAGSLIYDWENRRSVDPQIAPLSANEKIILASIFHSLYTIASQLSPVAKSSGVEVLETSQFRFGILYSPLRKVVLYMVLGIPERFLYQKFLFCLFI